MSGKITCEICGEECHAIQKHLSEAHPEVTLQEYKTKYPEAETLSNAAKAKIAERLSGTKKTASIMSEGESSTKQPLAEVFSLGLAPAAKSAGGADIPIEVLKSHEFEYQVPNVDENYVYNIELLKNVLMGLQTSMPVYLWGHSGTGKTTLVEQACARTNRPMIRVQHTLNTEEAHILGQWIVKDGETIFNPGWLPLAMKHGWVYLADEYDFAVPHVLSVYQPVLEGKSLVIKDACEKWRVVDPHPSFRIAATGNTNGVGDETGLYQGTQVQNAANYERFAIVQKVDFMDEKIEKNILETQAGMTKSDATNMVRFANKIRKNDQVSMPISPRSLINACRLGKFKGDFKAGIELAYLNRLPAIEREVAGQLVQRIFGEE
tara:strand:- start:11803 stop:12936 length:1134 start_codon:yes stop_codon:yes gene_type:complete